MRVLLAGQKRFGADVFKLALGLGHEVVAVCAPTTKIGTRDEDKLHFAASVEGVTIIPSGALKAAVVPEGVDLIITAHSHDFVSRPVRNRSRLGAIGYHPSLLPLHRGRDAVRWAVKLRERVTGGTIYWLNETVDGGDIAAQRHVFVRPEDDAAELWKRELAPLGLELMRDVLCAAEAGKEQRTPQDHALATWEPACDGAPRLYRPELFQIEWNQTA